MSGGLGEGLDGCCGVVFVDPVGLDAGFVGVDEAADAVADVALQKLPAAGDALGAAAFAGFELDAGGSGATEGFVLGQGGWDVLLGGEGLRQDVAVLDGHVGG
jgi:hypothetical protein